MRTLGKLKLIAVSAALVLGMSSCLKNDKKFAIYASPAYILQEGNRYQLQIQVQGNEQIKSASASLNGKNYSFSAVEGSQNFLMQINAYSARHWIRSRKVYAPLLLLMPKAIRQSANSSFMVRIKKSEMLR